MSEITYGFPSPFKAELSLEPIVRQLEKQVGEEAGDCVKEKRRLLAELSDHPELSNGIFDSQVMEVHRHLIKQLFSDYFPAQLSSNEIKAIGLPYQNQIFNHTDRFKAILRNAGRQFEFCIRDFDEHQLYVLSCCIILNKLYGTCLDFAKPLYYDIPTATGIVKHYRILNNADFLDIIPTVRAVPLGQPEIDLLRDNYENLGVWKRLFPPKSYVLRGIAIISLFDATVENAVSNFKGKLLDFHSDDFQQSLSEIFSSIYGIANLKVGYTLFFKEGDLNTGVTTMQYSKSLILGNRNLPPVEELAVMNEYLRIITGKKYLAVSDLKRFSLNCPDHFLTNWHSGKNTSGSVILAPVVRDCVILGVLEIRAMQENELNSINANKLDVVMPYLTQELERIAREQENHLYAIIQRRFTSLHSSVSWKFRQVVRLQMQAEWKGESFESEDIVFAGIIPMYGQVDIKGSSECRNLSTRKDLELQLNALLCLLSVVFETELENRAESVINQTKNLLRQLQNAYRLNSEHTIQQYLALKVHPLLVNKSCDKYQIAIDQYFSDQDKNFGLFYTYRRKYDVSIDGINNCLIQVLDNQQELAQQIFPHYYERYKSDGIEHNLYIGATICPGKNFRKTVPAALRLWQLKTMCHMERAYSLQRDAMPYPLEVTSLILVYNSPISIRFRMDEKRFDVDGTYSARYEMVKKRIDKACIKNTANRIVAAGYITVVYSSPEDKKDYLKHISTLQQQSLLEPGVACFDVEELQGVSGLKGLRVAVNYM